MHLSFRYHQALTVNVALWAQHSWLREQPYHTYLTQEMHVLFDRRSVQRSRLRYRKISSARGRRAKRKSIGITYHTFPFVLLGLRMQPNAIPPCRWASIPNEGHVWSQRQVPWMYVGTSVAEKRNPAQWVLIAFIVVVSTANSPSKLSRKYNRTWCIYFIKGIC